MTITGWVGEQVSADHTVVPNLRLADAEEATSGHDDGATKKQRRGLTRNRQQKPVQRDAEEGRSRVLIAAYAIGGVAVGVLGGVLAWPHVSGLLDSDQAPPVVAMIADEEDIEPTQQFVIEGNVLYLEGTVPSADVSSALEVAAGTAIGSDRVVNNFEVTPDAIYSPGAPMQLTVAETVLFQTGRAQLAERYEPLIALAADLMASQQTVHLTIVGHTDSIGEEELNLDLSLKRADATAEHFISRGIDPERLSTQGRGESQPIASNETPEGRQINRRVEFLITGLLG